MSMRQFLGRHFGEENVLWTAEEGPEPPDAELARRLSLPEAEITAVEAVMAMVAQGQDTGLTAAELALLPELLRRLKGEPIPNPLAPRRSNMDLEEQLEALAAGHQDAAAAYRNGETVSDQLAEAWEAEAGDGSEEPGPRLDPEEPCRACGERWVECSCPWMDPFADDPSGGQETAAQARERMLPAEQEQDREYEIQVREHARCRCKGCGRPLNEFDLIYCEGCSPAREAAGEPEKEQP